MNYQSDTLQHLEIQLVHVYIEKLGMRCDICLSWQAFHCRVLFDSNISPFLLWASGMPKEIPQAIPQARPPAQKRLGMNLLISGT